MLGTFNSVLPLSASVTVKFIFGPMAPVVVMCRKKRYCGAAQSAIVMSIVVVSCCVPRVFVSVYTWFPEVFGTSGRPLMRPV